MSAFVPIWRRPWMTIGPRTYGSSLLAAVGVRNVYGDASSPYPEVSLDAVAARSPDVVLAPSEPYAFSDAQLDELAAIAPVERIDGQDLFWWGARTPAAIVRLGAHLATLA
jgi:ABC-type hemin transport system substrate-binding protein